MANEALRLALREAGKTRADLAAEVEVDCKTVGRWIADGRIPHPRLRAAIATAVGMDEAMIWPEVVRSAVKTGADREVVQVFPSHSAVPTSVWQRLVAGAERELALAGATYEWLWYAVPSLNRVLRDKAQSGVRIRVVLSDPADPLIRADEQATAVPMALSTRIEQTRHLLEPLRDVVAVRQSAMGYGRGVIRSDDTATLHVWVHGALGTELPVLLLHRHQDGGLFDRMAVQHVDALFEAGRPVWG